jgi:hypothetical protein
MKKGLVAAGTVILVIAIVYVVYPRTDPPIYISDGSVVFQTDSSINTNSSTEVEVKKFNKVRSITVANSDGSGAPQSYPVTKKTDWRITGNNSSVTLSPSSYIIFGETVTGVCPSNWQANGKNYVCPSGQFTPATLTNNGVSSTLDCSTHKCRVELDY